MHRWIFEGKSYMRKDFGGGTVFVAETPEVWYKEGEVPHLILAVTFLLPIV